MNLPIRCNHQRVAIGYEVPSFALLPPLGKKPEADWEMVRSSLVVERKGVNALVFGFARIVIEPSFESIENLIAVNSRDVVVVFNREGGLEETGVQHSIERP